MGLVLDTSVFVEAERKQLPLAGFLKAIQERFGPEDLAVATVTVAELEHGIWRAADVERRQRQMCIRDSRARE